MYKNGVVNATVQDQPLHNSGWAGWANNRSQGCEAPQSSTPAPTSTTPAPASTAPAPTSTTPAPASTAPAQTLQCRKKDCGEGLWSQKSCECVNACSHAAVHAALSEQDLFLDESPESKLKQAAFYYKHSSTHGCRYLWGPSYLNRRATK